MSVKSTLRAVLPSRLGDAILPATAKMYDPDRYDLVEKPEWAKKRLKKEIEEAEKITNDYQTAVDNLTLVLEMSKTKLKDLREELELLS